MHKYNNRSQSENQDFRAEAAVRFAGQHALKLFPVQGNDKRPAIEKWEQHATSDPDQIRKWIKAGNRNIGVACGPSSIVVVDSDVKHGIDGEANLIALTAKLTTAENERASLEAQRGDVDVLDDAALDGYHADLARAEAVCVTLRMAADNLGAAIQRIEAAEAARAFEDRARRTAAESAETYAADLQELHDLTERIAALGPRLERARGTIDHTNAQAKERGRSDLALNTERLRRLVNQEIGLHAPDTSPIEIERMGESDEEWHARMLATLAERAKGTYRSEYPGASPSVKSREVQSRLRRAKEIFVERAEDEDVAAYEARLWASVAQHLNCHRAAGEDETAHAARLRAALARELKIERRGERDEAYQLRVSNAHMHRLRAMERQDPLVEAARAAARVIEAHCVSPEMGELHRHNQRLQRFVRWGDSAAQPPVEPIRREEVSRDVAMLPSLRDPRS